MVPMRTAAPFFDFGEGVARRDRSFVTIIRVLRSPFPEDVGRAANHHGAVVEAWILDQANLESLSKVYA